MIARGEGRMNLERDKFLTEAIGICIHEFTENPVFNMANCMKCNVLVSNRWYYPINFSTWEGFGELWEFCQKQEWWREFLERLIFWNGNLDGSIEPDRFADCAQHFIATKSKGGGE